MSPLQYQPLYLAILSVITCMIAWRFYTSPDDELSEKGQPNNIWICIPLCLVLVLWLGNRPVSSVFGDTFSYSHMYKNVRIAVINASMSGEWLFMWIIVWCRRAGLDVNGFFTVIDAIYIFTALLAVQKFVPKNPLLGMLFLCGSLMFFSYGTNGIRNGAACSIVLLAMAFLLESNYIMAAVLAAVAMSLHRSVALPLASIVAARWIIRDPRHALYICACSIVLLAMAFLLESNYIMAAVLAAVAMSLHRSVALPLASIVAARWIIRDPRHALYIWIGSIGLSLIGGNAFINFFSSLGFDDRMEAYGSKDAENYGFSSTGFRWDFLLYSAMPVYLGYTVLIKHQVRDNWYRILYSTYCLANAFWVLVIRAAFTNRFAYLSWFMYGIVVAYPLIMMRVWDDQDRRTAIILLAFVGFTVIMNTLYW